MHGENFMCPPPCVVSYYILCEPRRAPGVLRHSAEVEQKAHRRLIAASLVRKDGAPTLMAAIQLLRLAPLATATAATTVEWTRTARWPDGSLTLLEDMPPLTMAPITGA